MANNQLSRIRRMWGQSHRNFGSLRKLKTNNYGSYGHGGAKVLTYSKTAPEISSIYVRDVEFYLRQFLFTLKR